MVTRSIKLTLWISFVNVQPGKIHISHDSFCRLQTIEGFVCEYRGTVLVKVRQQYGRRSKLSLSLIQSALTFCVLKNINTITLLTG